MKYENLNEMVEKYRTIAWGAAGLLEKARIKKLLSDVPVRLDRFKSYLRKYYKAFASELETTAYLYKKQYTPFVFDKTSKERTLEMTKEYPVIFIKGENISEHFYGTTKVNFGKLFTRNRKNKSVNIYRDIFGEAVGISYRDKKDKLRYLEFRIAR